MTTTAPTTEKLREEMAGYVSPLLTTPWNNLPKTTQARIRDLSNLNGENQTLSLSFCVAAEMARNIQQTRRSQELSIRNHEESLLGSFMMNIANDDQKEKTSKYDLLFKYFEHGKITNKRGPKIVSKEEYALIKEYRAEDDYFKAATDAAANIHHMKKLLSKPIEAHRSDIVKRYGLETPKSP